MDLKKDECEVVLWTSNDKPTKIGTVLCVTNLGIIYKTKLDGIILSPRWSDIKSITYVDINHILVVWDDHDGSRWKYQITVKKDAKSAMDQIRKINLDWSKEMNYSDGFTKTSACRGFERKC
ncbi:MAG: hypothetical protein K8823_162 [Cenarchaeum symbiont of Oopsacas minuta]|nr:hypothetical protein [Cenarchaeum symbiont of Oopsacas minuta]